MRFDERAGNSGYKDQTIANNSSLIAWSSRVTNAKLVEGWCYANEAVDIELWALRPRTNADHSLQTTVVLNASLGTDWRLVETLAVAADTLESYSWALAPSSVRLLVKNTSGLTATVDVEVSTRTI